MKGGTLAGGTEMALTFLSLTTAREAETMVVTVTKAAALIECINI